MILICTLFFLFGCSLLLTGAGKSAQLENINFFKTTDDIKPNPGKYSNFPDYYYIAPNINWAKYRKIIVSDFSSMTSDVNKISGMQIPEFKNLRKDMPDNIAQSLDGSVFQQCIRSAQRIDHNDLSRIKAQQADAVLFGNISELKTGLRSDKGGHVGLTATQVEIKLVDRKTGQELIKIINRSSTDGDKVLMPIVKRIANVIQQAKSDNQGTAVSSINDKQEEPTTSEQRGNINSDLPVSYLIVTKRTNIRAEDNTKSKVIATAKLGEKVEKIDASEQWFKIRTAKGKSGWIIKNYAKEAE
jgi:hypothetical protein